MPRSRADARAWYERAAKQGHVQARNNLAAMAADLAKVDLAKVDLAQFGAKFGK